MSILIDPPVWPAHGTVWSHLASDASYGGFTTLVGR